MISDSTYMEFLESCAAFNKRISGERRHRMPFLDSQTGVAQNPSNLWRSKRDRRPGPDASVVFTYPAKRFKKRKSTINLLIADIKCVKAEEVFETVGAADSDTSISKIMPVEMKNQISDTKPESGEKETTGTRGEQSGWYDDLSDQDVDDYDDPSDGEDYEDTKRSKKKKKGGKLSTKGSRKQQNNDADIEKPHVCVYCGAKYKTKPGLHYHLTHVHTDMMEQPPAAAPTSSEHFSPLSSRTASNIVSTTPKQQQPETTNVSPAPSISPRGRASNVNQYCDFCLGDAAENKKTNHPEELISCKDCGRSGHPSCLQFTPNMIISTKRHGWQCIECKSCAMCGTSENDDQLLFCDDCDRGFHMYCLKPPLSSPPDGSWSCHLCVIEFGPNASNPGTQ